MGSTLRMIISLVWTTFSVSPTLIVRYPDHRGKHVIPQRFLYGSS
jgi:hypothetical protein